MTAMWTWAELNRRPPACKAGALPSELQARRFPSAWASALLTWACEDLNLGPRPYQGRALPPELQAPNRRVALGGS